MSGESASRKAMNKCRANVFTGKMCSESAGFRCIKDFEQINGVRFDPQNTLHVDTVTGMGPTRELLDDVKAIWARRVSRLEMATEKG